MTDQTRAFDPLKEALELRTQLSSDKRRICFLFGAGTSQAVGVPGIAPLTKQIGEALTGTVAGHYGRLLAEAGSGATVEDVLDIVRMCRELLRNRPGEQARGLTAADADALDKGICRLLLERVEKSAPSTSNPHTLFAGWIRSASRAYPIEIFTTNYDVLIERGLEAMEAPHFDGFVGTYEPRFSSASVEADLGRHADDYRLPRGWTRVWKLHGSVSWRLRKSSDPSPILIRVPHSQPAGGDDELMIFPSREKYSESRKLPFVAYHDRFRYALGHGEALLVTVGYSFSDQHINETIFEALRWNNRLAVTALIYGRPNEELRGRLLNATAGLANLSVYWADGACIGGIEGKWSKPGIPGDGSALGFWDSQKAEFTLGDFSAFADFLKTFLAGRSSAVQLTHATQSQEEAVPASGEAATVTPTHAVGQ